MQTSAFYNRLKKNYLHLKKWAKRENISAFRVYEKDIPQFPFIVDSYNGYSVLYYFEKTNQSEPEIDVPKKEESEEIEQVLEHIADVFQIPSNNIFLKIRKKQKGLSQYEKLENSETWQIVTEGELKFKVNLSLYLDTGLFLDHRKIRKLILEIASQTRFLNLFAYTGSISVAAAVGYAKEVTTVDMSNTYLSWAKENFILNGIKLQGHQFIRADIQSWLPKQKNSQYDVIFLDPPSFSNSKKMQSVFDVQKDYPELILHCHRLLDKNGVLIFPTNLRTFKFEADKFSPYFIIEEITQKTMPPDFRNKKIHSAWLLRKKD